ncbi:hypothetical protein EVAR_57_1 [Eumeta japonica]|uniref:Uncharacterized protein n=1 Tax=Eumeta variegata TaxID=151549 RepID=A0A4C1S7U3_EUMVA|nr:hypothetical protein EVAR_57_1 [Eumeta japonica]
MNLHAYGPSNFRSPEAALGCSRTIESQKRSSAPPEDMSTAKNTSRARALHHRGRARMKSPEKLRTLDGANVVHVTNRNDERMATR